MICGDCSASLKGATQCSRCGWKVPPHLQPDPTRAPDLRPGPRKGWQSNPHMEAVREAYAKSQARRSDAGIGAVREAMSAMREPGSDDEESAAQDGGSQPVDASIERGSVPSQDAQARQIPAAPDAVGLPLGIERDSLEQAFLDAAQP